MALISLEHVSKIYPKGTRPALDDVTLDIERGDFVFLVGASGSGKTTLLSLLLREEEATDGEIRVAGNDLRRLRNRQVPQYRRSIGFVFQDYKLLNNKTVWQNVAFALEVIGISRSAIKAMVPKVLDTVGLTGKERNYPHELSGGEQQRVAIARAYVNHPQILLADEPTGNLDPTTSLGIMEVLDAINRTGTTIVMATHNEEIVNSMRKRVVELHNGKIVRDEARGSYDSALFFPDAEVESKSQRSIGAQDDDARFRPAGEGDAPAAAASGDRGALAAKAVDMVAQAMAVGSGDEGIARLAQSVHSGRTGRYGEAFTPVENTLTWGRGLSLEEMARHGRNGADASDATDGGSAADASASDAAGVAPSGNGVPSDVAADHVPDDAAVASATPATDSDASAGEDASAPGGSVASDGRTEAAGASAAAATSSVDVEAAGPDGESGVPDDGDQYNGAASGAGTPGPRDNGAASADMPVLAPPAPPTFRRRAAHANDSANEGDNR